jgi:hypothetical protein
MTDNNTEKRKAAQNALMQENAFAIVFDGVGATILIAPDVFEVDKPVHLHALAIDKMQEIMSDYDDLCDFLELDAPPIPTMWLALILEEDEDVTRH